MYRLSEHEENTALENISCCRSIVEASFGCIVLWYPWNGTFYFYYKSSENWSVSFTHSTCSTEENDIMHNCRIKKMN